MPASPSSTKSRPRKAARRSPTRLLDIRLGDPRRHENLTVFPLLASEAGPMYALLAEALAAGDVTIKEMGSGVVPTLIARNSGKRDVLVLDGEQLIGAKQNRITNRTLILEAGTETEIPVSCMEQRRWHFVSDQFTPRGKPMHASSKVRRHARDVEAAYAAVPHRATHRVLADAQGAVWDEIGVSSGRLGVHSDTGAMSDMYDRRESDLASWTKRFPAEENQVGLLAFLGGAVLGLDAVGNPALYARLHERLLGGYIMDAFVDRGETAGEVTEEEASAFLALAGKAKRGRAPTVGKGTYRLLSGGVVGGELEDDGNLAHLSAFPGLERRPGETRSVDSPPIRRPSHRRRGYLGDDTDVES